MADENKKKAYYDSLVRAGVVQPETSFEAFNLKIRDSRYAKIVYSGLKTAAELNIVKGVPNENDFNSVLQVGQLPKQPDAQYQITDVNANPAPMGTPITQDAQLTTGGIGTPAVKPQTTPTGLPTMESLDGWEQIQGGQPQTGEYTDTALSGLPLSQRQQPTQLITGDALANAPKQQFQWSGQAPVQPQVQVGSQGVGGMAPEQNMGGQEESGGTPILPQEAYDRPLNYTGKLIGTVLRDIPKFAFGEPLKGAANIMRYASQSLGIPQPDKVEDDWLYIAGQTIIDAADYVMTQGTNQDLPASHRKGVYAFNQEEMQSALAPQVATGLAQVIALAGTMGGGSASKAPEAINYLSQGSKYVSPAMQTIMSGAAKVFDKPAVMSSLQTTSQLFGEANKAWDEANSMSKADYVNSKIINEGATKEEASETYDLLKSRTRDEVAQSTLPLALLVAQTEKLPLEAMFKWVPESTYSRIMNMGLTGGVGLVTEYLQEGFQTGIQNIGVGLLYDKTRDTFAGLSDASSTGGLTGFVMGLFIGALKKRRANLKAKIDSGEITNEEAVKEAEEINKTEQFVNDKIDAFEASVAMNTPASKEIMNDKGAQEFFDKNQPSETNALVVMPTEVETTLDKISDNILISPEGLHSAYQWVNNAVKATLNNQTLSPAEKGATLNVLSGMLSDIDKANTEGQKFIGEVEASSVQDRVPAVRPEAKLPQGQERGVPNKPKPQGESIRAAKKVRVGTNVLPSSGETIVTPAPQGTQEVAKPTFENVPIYTRTEEEIEFAKNEVFDNLNKLEIGSVIENSDGEIKVITEKSTDKKGNQIIGIVVYERQPDGSLRQMTNPIFSTKKADGKISIDYNPHTTGTNSKGERVTVTDQITDKKIDLSKEDIFIEENGELIQINKADKSSQQSNESKTGKQEESMLGGVRDGGNQGQVGQESTQLRTQETGQAQANAEGEVETDNAIMSGEFTDVAKINDEDVNLPEKGFIISDVTLKPDSEKGKGSGQEVYKKALDKHKVLYSFFPVSEDAQRVQDKLVEKGIATIENITLPDGTEARVIRATSTTSQQVQGQPEALGDVESTAKALEGVGELKSEKGFEFVGTDKLKGEKHKGLNFLELINRLATDMFGTYGIAKAQSTIESEIDKLERVLSRPDNFKYEPQKAKPFEEELEQLKKYRDLGIKNVRDMLISEAYHKAEADGSNPELVKAVEELLGTPQSPTQAPVATGGQEGVEQEETDITSSELPNETEKTSVRDLASMQEGELSAGVFSELNLGDKIVIGNKEYVVTTKTKGNKKTEFKKKDGTTSFYTKSTLTLKDVNPDLSLGKPISGTLVEYENGRTLFTGGDKWRNLSRDIEGDVTVDLVNENNKFHTPSHSFKLAQQYVDKANSNLPKEKAVKQPASPPTTLAQDARAKREALKKAQEEAKQTKEPTAEEIKDKSAIDALKSERDALLEQFKKEMGKATMNLNPQQVSILAQIAWKNLQILLQQTKLSSAGVASQIKKVVDEAILQANQMLAQSGQASLNPDKDDIVNIINSVRKLAEGVVSPSGNNKGQIGTAEQSSQTQAPIYTKEQEELARQMEKKMDEGKPFISRSEPFWTAVKRKTAELRQKLDSPKELLNFVEKMIGTTPGSSYNRTRELPLGRAMEQLRGKARSLALPYMERISEILKPIESNLPDFEKYLIYRRIIDRAIQDKANQEAYNQGLLKKKPVRRTTGGMTETNADILLNDLRNKIGVEMFDSFTQAGDDLQQVFDDNLKDLVDAGVLTQDRYDAIKAQNNFYIPFDVVQRDFRGNVITGTEYDRTNAQGQSVIKKIKGIDVPKNVADANKTIEVFYKMMQNGDIDIDSYYYLATEKITDARNQGNITQEEYEDLMDSLSEPGLELHSPLNKTLNIINASQYQVARQGYMEDVDGLIDADTNNDYFKRLEDGEKLPSGMAIITYYKDGVQQRVAVDEKLKQAIDGMTKPELSAFGQVLKVASIPFKIAATSASVTFLPVNFVIDTVRTLTSKAGFGSGANITERVASVVQVPVLYSEALVESIIGNLLNTKLGNALGLKSITPDFMFKEYEAWRKSPSYSEGTYMNYFTDKLKSGRTQNEIEDAKFLETVQRRTQTILGNPKTAKAISEAVLGGKQNVRLTVDGLIDIINIISKILENSHKIYGNIKLSGTEAGVRRGLDVYIGGYIDKLHGKKRLTQAELENVLEEINDEVLNNIGSPNFEQIPSNMRAASVMIPFLGAAVKGNMTDISRMMNAINAGASAKERKDALIFSARNAAIFTIPAFVTALTMALKDDDDEGKKMYDEMDENSKWKNKIIPIERDIDGEVQTDFVTIPIRGLPVIFNSIGRASGQAFGEAIKGKLTDEEINKISKDLIASSISEMMTFNLADKTYLSDINPETGERKTTRKEEEWINRSMSAISGLNPLIKYPLERIANTNFFGKYPLLPESIRGKRLRNAIINEAIDPKTGEPYSPSLLKNKFTPEYSVNLSKKLERNGVKVSPIVIDHFFDTFLAGAPEKFDVGASESMKRRFLWKERKLAYGQKPKTN